jgi:hypothetical protein
MNGLEFEAWKFKTVSKSFCNHSKHRLYKLHSAGSDILKFKNSSLFIREGLVVG